MWRTFACTSLFPADADFVLQLFDGVGRVTTVKHCMAVWAYRDEIFNRVDLVFVADLGERNEMMHMNKPFTNLSKVLTKRKTTNRAGASMFVQTCFPCSRITLICVDVYSSNGSLIVSLGRSNLTCDL